MAEYDLYGIFISPLLVWGMVALALSGLVRGLLARIGFYRFVWHPALFDLALFVILLGAAIAFSLHRI